MAAKKIKAAMTTEPLFKNQLWEQAWNVEGNFGVIAELKGRKMFLKALNREITVGVIKKLKEDLSWQE